ncbi:hypothetical protein BKA56DRAFT_255147 [Ilyonectria sp. MPI-CAGE-AT-0026]|nr:hypothetical protein BKA56DRAFT_255147 [Ilyonectria sp. MPI-CAGE-AT-0026]
MTNLGLSGPRGRFLETAAKKHEARMGCTTGGHVLMYRLGAACHDGARQSKIKYQRVTPCLYCSGGTHEPRPSLTTMASPTDREILVHSHTFHTCHTCHTCPAHPPACSTPVPASASATELVPSWRLVSWRLLFALWACVTDPWTFRGYFRQARLKRGLPTHPTSTNETSFGMTHHGSNKNTRIDSWKPLQHVSLAEARSPCPVRLMQVGLLPTEKRQCR